MAVRPDGPRGDSPAQGRSAGTGDTEGPVPDRAADGDPEPRARDEVRAERDRRLAVGPAGDHERDADDAAEEEREERPERNLAPAEPAQDHAEDACELHVAEAHPPGVDDAED